MKITQLTSRLVKLPTRRPHRWASLTAELGSWLILEIETDEGLTGFGEATALAQWAGESGRYYGETPGLVRHVIENFYAPVLLGQSPLPVSNLLQCLGNTIKGHHYARTAVEGALLDIRARAAGVPVYDLLGGKLRDTIPITHSFGLMDIDAAVEEARHVVAEGIKSLKIKTGEDATHDIEKVRAIRDTVGDDVAIAVDANCGWGTATEAQRVIRALEPVTLRYVEQPVPSILDMEILAPKVTPPLMADESAWTARDVVDIVRGRAADLVSIYTSKAGGLLSARKMDCVAHAHGLGTNVNGSGETGVGNLGNLHLAACAESITESSTLPVTRLSDNRPTEFAQALYTDDLLEQPVEYRDGAVVVPDGPGWGIAVDRAKLAEYTVEETKVQ